jgi:hypothetical protein
MGGEVMAYAKNPRFEESNWTDPRWQRLRLEVMQRDNFLCCCCKDGTTMLNVHHKKYNGAPWEVPAEELQTLCRPCHEALGEHPKAGVWWEIDGSGHAVACVKWCPQCGDETFVIHIDGDDDTHTFQCQKCWWQSTGIKTPKGMSYFWLSCRSAFAMTAGDKKRIDEMDKHFKKREATVRRIMKDSALLRSEFRFSDREIWELTFPEMPSPFGVNVCGNGGYVESERDVGVGVRFLNIVRAGMSNEDLSEALVELAGSLKNA